MLPKAARRRVAMMCVGAYILASLLCLGLSTVDRFPPFVDAAATIIVPYTFFLLGPPFTLTLGVRAIPLYLVETIAVAGMILVSGRVFHTSIEAFVLMLLAVIALWIASAMLVAVVLL